MELKTIRKSVRDLEREASVKILYACESGSRAWGFESTDSDYDVRFIYSNRADWYMSVDIDVKRDVIEKPIDGDLDINGWVLRKSLKLLKKSNPICLLELFFCKRLSVLYIFQYIFLPISQLPHVHLQRVVL